MRIWYLNLADDEDTVLTATSEVSTLPVSNIQHDFRKKVFRSASRPTTFYVTLDLVTAQAVTSLFLLDHTIASDCTITLEASSNNFAAVHFTQSVTWVSEEIATVFSSQSYRYWRLKIVSAATPVATALRQRNANVATITTPVAHGILAGDLVTVASMTDASYNVTAGTVLAVPTPTTLVYSSVGANEVPTVDAAGTVTRVSVPIFDIGRMFLGTYTTLTDEPEFTDYSEANNDPSRVQRTLGGQEYVEEVEKYKTLDLTWKLARQATYNELKAVNDWCGRSRSFFVQIDTVVSGLAGYYYVRQDTELRGNAAAYTDAYTSVGEILWDISLRLKEQV